MASNFSDDVLAGGSAEYARITTELRERYGFDFVGFGLTAFVGAPLRWVYSAGATSERHRRIVLAPGHGIGGIVIKTGKPMLFLDIDRELDPREYSSYPIVFAEDLRSFCCLPLRRAGHVVGALLCAFRTSDPAHRQTYARLIEDLAGRFADLDVVADDFMSFEGLAQESAASREWASPAGGGTGAAAGAGLPQGRSQLSAVIGAQEDERRRISRDLHDGVAQEILTVSLALRQLEGRVAADEGARELVQGAIDNIGRILDELHNISVELRPLSLDHLGFVAALHSQASVLEKTYGTRVVFSGQLSRDRFSRALETQAYRICQEAILNACKYSGADTVSVHLEDAGGWLQVRVRDEGCGFDAEHPTIRGSGCGLVGMRERAELIGATLNVASGPGGTTVTLVAPMDAGEPTPQVTQADQADQATQAARAVRVAETDEAGRGREA